MGDFMRYTAVVIDNDLQELTRSVEKLQESGIFKKITPFSDVEEAIKYIDDNGCDVLFTEIELEKIDGFKLGRRYGRSNLTMCFVFLTSLETYAFDAFKLSVTDFALKPLDIDAIKRVVKKIRNKQYFEISELR